MVSRKFPKPYEFAFGVAASQKIEQAQGIPVLSTEFYQKCTLHSGSALGVQVHQTRYLTEVLLLLEVMLLVKIVTKVLHFLEIS